MKIKLLVPLNGPGGGGIEGDVIEWEDEDAYRFINAGYAEFVPTVEETAADFAPLPEIVADVVTEESVSEPVVEDPAESDEAAVEAEPVAEAAPVKRARKAKA